MRQEEHVERDFEEPGGNEWRGNVRCSDAPDETLVYDASKDPSYNRRLHGDRVS